MVTLVDPEKETIPAIYNTPPQPPVKILRETRPISEKESMQVSEDMQQSESYTLSYYRPVYYPGVYYSILHNVFAKIASSGARSAAWTLMDLKCHNTQFSGSGSSTSSSERLVLLGADVDVSVDSEEEEEDWDWELTGVSEPDTFRLPVYAVGFASSEEEDDE
uniref:Uncharacterized protein n=1 Tax=Anopheles farauti TaxID=69004 RepID=A0A182QKI7_9DIPT